MFDYIMFIKKRVVHALAFSIFMSKEVKEYE